MTRLPSTLLALSLLLAAAAPLAPARPLPVRSPYTHLLEIRGEATVARELEKMRLPSFTGYHQEEAFAHDFYLDRDTPFLGVCHSWGPSSTTVDLTPSDKEAYFSLHAGKGWEHLPDTPEGFQVWTPPNHAFTNYYAIANGRLVGSESANVLRADFETLAGLPASLPAEGTVVAQYSGHALNIVAACVAESDLGTAIPENVATFTVGFGLDDDGDATLIHAVLSPVPGSELDAWIRALRPFIPDDAACVDVPDAIATVAVASLPLLPSFLRGTLPPHLAEHAANRAVSFSLLPPAVPPRATSALFYATAPDPARSFQTLDAWYGGLATNRVHSPTVLFAPAPRRGTAWSGPRDSVRDFLVNSRPGWRFAPLPGALLAANNSPDGAIDTALDAALDGGLPPRHSSPPSDFFPPDTTPLAILRADLRALLDAYPAVGRVLCPFLAKHTWAGNVRVPLPLDAILYIQEGNLVLRIRGPHPANTPVNMLSMAAMWTWELRKGTPLSGGETPSVKPETALPSLGPAPQGMPSGGQAVPIAPVPFLGYPESYVLRNSRLHAVVVPAIGRLAFLSFAPDAPNLLRLDPALAEAGATPPDPSASPGFFNIGGDWAWPVIQAHWPSMAPYGADWPPPAALADAPCDASAWREPDGSQHVLLSRRYPPPVSATLTREFIVFPHDSPVLRCEQTLAYGPGPIEETPVPVALWNVTQFANPHRIGCQIPSEKVLPTVLRGTLDPSAYRVNHVIHDFTAVYDPSPGAEVKLAFPPPPAPFHNGQTASLSAHSSNANLHVSTSDPGHHGELYSNHDLGYAQLEILSPEIDDAAPNSGNLSISNTIFYWIGPTDSTRHFLHRAHPPQPLTQESPQP